MKRKKKRKKNLKMKILMMIGKMELRVKWINGTHVCLNNGSVEVKLSKRSVLLKGLKVKSEDKFELTIKKKK